MTPASGRPLTILVTAVGAPGAAALLRNLRQNGEREVRLVGSPSLAPVPEALTTEESR